MECQTCARISKRIEVNSLNWESLPDYVKNFEELGYYGNDEFSVTLRKCPKCNTYYEVDSTDSFETGGGVSESIQKVDKNTAIEAIKKIMEKIRSSERLKSSYSLSKLEKELKLLEK